MAGDWIKFELTTLDKPEVCQIADLADIDLDAAVGKLLRVWGWFDQQTENGNAPSVSKKLLDRLVGVTGFCEHMKAVGWMIEEEGVISLPHFERHNGKTAKNRLLTAKRVANHKAANAKGNDKGNAANVSDALPKEDVEKIKDIPPKGSPKVDSARDSFDPLSACPPNVGLGVWRDYAAHRKAKKSKLTERACELIAQKLINHPNPDAVLLRSIENGWTGVFPEQVPHGQSQRDSGQGDNSAVGRVKQAIAAREAAEARSAAAGQTLAEDDRDLRSPLDGEFRRVG